MDCNTETMDYFSDGCVNNHYNEWIKLRNGYVTDHTLSLPTEVIVTRHNVLRRVDWW